MKRETTIVIALAVGLLSACGATSTAPAESSTTPGGSPAPSVGPYDPDAQMRPELMQVKPSPAVAGQPIEVRFPEETERGVGWVLEEQGNNSWHAGWSLTAASGSYDSEYVPNWYPADDEAAFALGRPRHCRSGPRYSPDPGRCPTGYLPSLHRQQDRQHMCGVGDQELIVTDSLPTPGLHSAKNLRHYAACRPGPKTP